MDRGKREKSLKDYSKSFDLFEKDLRKVNSNLKLYAMLNILLMNNKS